MVNGWGDLPAGGPQPASDPPCPEIQVIGAILSGCRRQGMAGFPRFDGLARAGTPRTPQIVSYCVLHPQRGGPPSPEAPGGPQRIKEHRQRRPAKQQANHGGNLEETAFHVAAAYRLLAMGMIPHSRGRNGPLFLWTVGYSGGNNEPNHTGIS